MKQDHKCLADNPRQTYSSRGEEVDMVLLPRHGHSQDANSVHTSWVGLEQRVSGIGSWLRIMANTKRGWGYREEFH